MVTMAPHEAYKVVEGFAPQVLTATNTPVAIDTAGYQEALVVLHVGAWTDGTFTTTVTHCATSGGTYAAITGAAFTVVDGAPDDATIYVGRINLAQSGVERYLKVLCTVTGTPTTGVLIGCTVLLLGADKPVTQLNTADFNIVSA